MCGSSSIINPMSSTSINRQWDRLASILHNIKEVKYNWKETSKKNITISFAVFYNYELNNAKKKKKTHGKRTKKEEKDVFVHTIFLCPKLRT